ncbi:hypothetical protein QJQ45_029519 [Haematococcus lacustris]|nr:hypothetical protein QJQ45_029519 [Haematococcus lacustris]
MPLLPVAGRCASLYNSTTSALPLGSEQRQRTWPARLRCHRFMHTICNASKTNDELPGGGWPQPKVTLSVEGNISAGKSTFLRIIQNAASLQAKLQVVPEPVDKWQDVGQQHVNLLGEFYKDPHRFAYTFQNYVFLTRVVQERDSYVQPAPCRVLERSVFSDRMVFVRAGHAAGYITDTELSIYDAWFDPVLTTLPTLVPHAFIYLRAQPETCHARLLRRGRQEENTVQLSYLQELHGRHEDWLYQGGHEVRSQGSGAPLHLWASSSPATPHHIAPHVVAGNGSSHVSNSNGCRGSSQEACQGNGSSPASTQPTGLPLTAPQQPPSGDSAQQVGDIHPPSSQPTPQGGPQHPGLAIKLHAPFFSVHGHAVAAQLAQQHGWVSEPLPELPASLQGWVRFLDVSGKPHMHPLLHMRPALIIDCDADVDVHNDLQFQTSLAKMVADFADYARDCMLARARVQLRWAAGQQQQQQHRHNEGAQCSSLAQGAMAFDGYSVQHLGSTMYLHPEAPWLGHATAATAMAHAAATGAAGAHKGRQEGEAAAVAAAADVPVPAL